MTRTESGNAADREALKKEVVSEIERDAGRKKLAGCGGCLLAALIIIGVPLVWGASIAAKSGFIHVPLLSKWLYQPSQPERQVVPLVGSNSTAILKSVIAANQYDQQTGIMTIRFSEEQLTTFVKEAVAANPNLLPFPVSSAQIAVDPSGVELFMVSPQSGGSATVKINVTPRVEKEQLQFTVNQIMFGGLAVPNSLANALVSSISGKLNDSIRASMGQIGTLEGVTLEKRMMIVSFVPKLPVR